MDPEDVRTLVDRAMARMGAIVDSFGGFACRVIGDELMALFGAPTAHANDAERAVRAALEIQRRAGENAWDFGGLSLRIGLNTGEMMLAPLGPDRNLTVSGDAVNTASRLQSSAPPGGILAGEETQRATRRAIRYEPWEPLEVKGKRAPLHAFLAREALGSPAEGALAATRIVGRDAELDVLRTLWERATSTNTPHLVTIVGAPGIGKTRLYREMAWIVRNAGGRVAHGRSLPYGQGTGYGAFAQQVKEAAGIFQSDPSAVAREKLAHRIKALGLSESEDLVSRLALLIGLDAGGGFADRGPLFEAARRFAAALASEQPTLFVFEDIHWADPSLLDLIESVATRSRGAPALYLALARPELLELRPAVAESPGGVGPTTMLQLEALSPAHCRELVSRLVPTETGPEVIDRLAETAAGNPLFVEELTAAFVERKTDLPARFPTNVQEIIAARIDALTPAERGLVLNASVVGKVFWRGALERLGGTGDTVSTLESLEARDLVHREASSTFEGDEEFSFRHILIREVAYATVPKATRRQRHAAVARFIEVSAGDRTGESASLLAHHWREAADAARAVHYLVMAAENASRAWAKGEALGLLTQALELIPEEDRARRARVRLIRATTLRENTDYPAAAAEFDAVLPELDGRDQIEALIGRSRACYWLVDTEGAQQYSSRAVDLAGRLDDEQLRARALSAASLAAALVGNLSHAIDLGEAALAQWDAGRDTAELGIHAGFVGAYQYWAGRCERAAECSRRSFDLGMQTHNVEAMVAGGGNLGMALAGLGRHEEALQLFERIVALGNEVELKPTFTGRATNMWAGTLREILDLRRARELNEAGIEVARRTGFAWGHMQGRIDLIVADLAEGDVASAEKAWPGLWEEALATKGLHRWLMAGRLATLRAEIALGLGKPEEAAHAAREALAFAQRYGRRKYEVASRVALGSALLELGQAAPSVAELRRAMAEAEALGHPPSLWRTARALTRALEAVGDDQAAGVASLTAADTVRSFARGLSQERRDTFLAASPVEEILAAASSKSLL